MEEAVEIVEEGLREDTMEGDTTEGDKNRKKLYLPQQGTKEGTHIRGTSSRDKI